MLLFCLQCHRTKVRIVAIEKGFSKILQNYSARSLNNRWKLKRQFNWKERTVVIWIYAEDALWKRKMGFGTKEEKKRGKSTTKFKENRSTAMERINFEENICHKGYEKRQNCCRKPLLDIQIFCLMFSSYYQFLARFRNWCKLQPLFCLRVCM